MPIDLLTTLQRKNAGDFPLLGNTDVLGGWMTVADNTARDAIASTIRQEGMHVWSVGAGALYRLGGDLATWAAVSLGGGGATLDQAYDQGGAGAGRTINADSGAVVMASAAANTNNVLELTKNPAASQDGSVLSVVHSNAGSEASVHVSSDGFAGLRLQHPDYGAAEVNSPAISFLSTTDIGDGGFAAENHSFSIFISNGNLVLGGDGVGDCLRITPTYDQNVSALKGLRVSRGVATKVMFSAVHPSLDVPDGDIAVTCASIGGGSLAWNDNDAVATIRWLDLQAPSFTSSVATKTITTASTLYINGAPYGNTGVTITDTYALFIDSGRARFDGDGAHIFELPVNATDPTAGGTAAAAGRIAARIGGATMYIPYYAP